MQLAENDLQVILVVHLVRDAVQIVFNGGGAEAAVKLSDVIIVEGERLIADDHLIDLSYSALSAYNAGR